MGGYKDKNKIALVIFSTDRAFEGTYNVLVQK
jgi:hypothetical protein